VRLLGHQRVVRPSIGNTRVQVFSVHVARERPRLAHQPTAEVAIVDAVLVLPTQPFHRLLQDPRVPHLDLLRADPHLDRLTHEPGRHRVGIMLDPNRAAPPHLHPLTLARFQAPRRQRPQTSQLGRQPRLAAGVAAAHQFVQELPIGLTARKVATAPQQQRLLGRLFEAPVRLLAVAILVAAGRIGRLGVQTVMGQQRPVLGGVLLGLALVVHGQCHAVGAMPLGHTPQLGQRVLQPFAETGETLRKADGHVLPVRMRKDEVVDQMRERLAGDGHGQRFHVREIRSTQAARFMDLGEEYFLGRPVLGFPLPHPPFQRPLGSLPGLLRKFTLQPFPQGLGLQAGLPLEQFLQPRPHRRQRIDACPPRTRGRLLARQLGMVPVLSGSFAIHACTHRRLRQRCPPQQSLPQFLHLGVGSASSGTHRQLLSPELPLFYAGHAPLRTPTCSSIQWGRLVVAAGEG